MSGQLISLRAYSRHRGVTLSAVQKAVSSGRIRLIDGKVDPDVADIQWARNTQADQQERGSLEQFEKTQAQVFDLSGLEIDSSPAARAMPATNTLASEKTETETIRRQLLEIELRKKRGELVEIDSVRRAWGEKVRAARESLDTMADRLAPIIAAETDVKKVDAMLRAEVRQAMTNVAQLLPQAERVE